MKKTCLTGLLALICLSLIWPFFADAAPVGKITRIEGRVDVLKAGQRTVTPVSLGNVVDVGDIYRTKTDGRAEITFFNKNIVRIAPATRMQVSQYSDDGNRSNQIMKLERGKVEAVSSEEFVKKVSSFAEGNKFEVHTPNAVAGIRGSGMTTGFAQMVTGLFFATGRGYFYNPIAPARIVNVSAGFVSFIVGSGGFPSLPVPGSVSYVGGGAGAAPGGGGAAEGTGGPNLNLQVINLTQSLDNTFVFNQQPPPVPNVFVGSVPSLSGTYTDPYRLVTLSLNNVNFYGPSATGVPQSWQAVSVTGTSRTYWDAPHGESMEFALSGSGMTANFIRTSNVKISESQSTFTANITSGKAPSGVGTCTQAFTFSGTATGTWNRTVSSGGYDYGTISGNASGVVPSVLNQEPIAVTNIYVGSIPYLSGGPGATGIDVMLNNVKFHGPSTTSVPSAWVAGSVSGNANSTPGTGTYVLTGPNASATLTVTSAGSTSFTGTVTGGYASSITGGTYTGKPVAFQGTASGTYPMAGGPIAGSASGTAQVP